MILLVENIRGGISSDMGDRCFESDANKTLLYIDATKLYGLSMSKPLTFVEINFEKNVCLENILKPRDDSDIGYFLKVELSYSY